MKIFLICSKRFYPRVPKIVGELETKGHAVTLPNSYDNPATEEKYKKLGMKAHAEWKAEMLKRSTDIIGKSDAVLVLNFEKDGAENYIGGATFLEMHDAFRLGKAIFLFNSIPEGILHDEIVSFSPIVINGDLDRVK